MSFLGLGSGTVICYGSWGMKKCTTGTEREILEVHESDDTMKKIVGQYLQMYEMRWRE